MEDIIKMHEVGCEGMDWFHLAQEIVQWQDFVNTVMNLQTSQKT
jgi:hypothetical protein